MKPELRNQKPEELRPVVWRRSAALLVSGFWFLVFSACVTITPRTQRAGTSAVVIPDVPIQKWGIESCGAGSLSTILQHYGDPTTMAQWDATLPKTHGGVMTVDMLLAARQKGFEAKLVTGTPAIVTDELRAGRPLLLMLQVVDSPGHQYDFFHYIVVDGYDPEHNLIRTQFGDRRPRWISFGRLEKPWSGGGHAAILIRPRTEQEAVRGAVALESEGRYSDAEAAYQELLRTYRGTPLVWTNLGNAQMQLGQTADAEQSFRKALELDPGSRDALNNLAWLLYQQQRLADAESFARRAVAQNGPDGWLVLDTLARILAARGDCAGAAATFRSAIDSVPAGHADARNDLQHTMDETARTCVRQ